MCGVRRKHLATRTTSMATTTPVLARKVVRGYTLRAQGWAREPESTRVTSRVEGIGEALTYTVWRPSARTQRWRLGTSVRWARKRSFRLRINDRRRVPCLSFSDSPSHNLALASTATLSSPPDHRPRGPSAFPGPMNDHVHQVQRRQLKRGSRP